MNMNRSGLWTIAGVMAIGLSKRKGSRSQELTWNPLGFPWVQKTPLWHATANFTAIMRSRKFKSRHDLRVQKQSGSTGHMLSATGGGPDDAVSMTLDYRVGMAICVGLNVFRRIANDDLAPTELSRVVLERFRQSPSTLKELRKHYSLLFNEGFLLKLEQGYLLKGYYWPYTLGMDAAEDLTKKYPQFKTSFGAQFNPQTMELTDVPNLNKWAGAEHDYVNSFFIRPEFVRTDPLMVEVQKRQKMGFMAEMYKACLAYGDGNRLCYNPLFFGTHIEDFIGVRESDIGIVLAFADIDRISLSPRFAWDLRYLDKQEAQAASRNRMADNHRSIESDMDMIRYGRTREAGDYTSHVPFFGEFPVENPKNLYLRTDSTMIGMDSMAEVRVYDLSQLKVMGQGKEVPGKNANWGWFFGLEESRSSRRLTDIYWDGKPLASYVFFPWFSDREELREFDMLSELKGGVR